MSARLPIPGSDDNTWGNILNTFLAISHNSDGTLQTTAIQQAGAITSVNGKDSTTGAVTLIASDVGAATLAETDNRYIAAGAPVTAALTDEGGQVFNVKAFGATGNGTVDDTAAINAAISATDSRGGIIFFPTGTYKVNSVGRTDVISSVSGTTIYDSSCAMNDIGSYCIGTGVNGRAMEIVAVNPGISFTVDTAPAEIPNSLFITKTPIVLSEGVQLVGSGSTFTTNGFGSGNASTSKIYDSGNGITILIRGSGPSTGNAASRYKIQDLSVWGNAGSTYCGLFVSNMSWFLTIENCDLSFHGTAGAIFDGNINSHDIRNTIFYGNGSLTATGHTGGVITNPFWSQPSAALNFYNCFFNANKGWGITGSENGGAYAINLYGCQFNNTVATAAPNSGTSMMLSSQVYGSVNVIGCWSESATTYDLYTMGAVVIQGSHLASATSYHWYNAGGSATVIGCWFNNASTATLQLGSGANVTWNTTTIEDPYFFSGGPANSVILGLGSSYGISSAGGGISPGSFGESTSNRVWQGSGLPPNTDGNDGDIYFRTDTPTVVNQRLYVRTSGSWMGII